MEITVSIITIVCLIGSLILKQLRIRRQKKALSRMYRLNQKAKDENDQLHWSFRDEAGMMKEQIKSLEEIIEDDPIEEIIETTEVVKTEEPLKEDHNEDEELADLIKNSPNVI